MKKYIKSNDQVEKIFEKVQVSDGSNYAFSGQVSNDVNHPGIWGNISRISPYNDAEYTWAKISPNGRVIFIRDTQKMDGLQLWDYDEDYYESLEDYYGELIMSVAQDLADFNKDIEPIMVHN